MAEIANIIKKIATEGHKIQTCPAKVIAINEEAEKSLHDPEDAYTVDVVRPDGAVICNVRLKASIQNKDQGFICVPKLESWVLISIIETTETRAFISQYSEIDKIFLRIANDNDEYVQIEKKASSLNVLFKKKKETTAVDPGIPDYKKVSQLTYGGDTEKSLKVHFYNEEEQQQVIVDAELDKDSIDFKFNDDLGEVLQQSTFSKDEVKTVFEEGYQSIITKDNVQLTKGQLNFELIEDERFKIEAGGENLKKQLNDLITEISKIVVAQGVSPDVGALIKINENINKIME